MAADPAGRVGRDGLTLDEEACLSDALDDAVESVLPQVRELIELALAPGSRRCPPTPA